MIFDNLTHTDQTLRWEIGEIAIHLTMEKQNDDALISVEVSNA